MRGMVAGAMILLSAASASAEDAGPAPASPAAPPSPPAANMQEPAVGDHWTYRITDEISGSVTSTRTVVVTELSKNEVTTRFDVTGTGRSGMIVYDRSWDVLSDDVFRYSPNDGTGVHLPLTAGAQWKFAVDSVNSNTGATFKRTGTGRVTGKETITTKAGTFETFVVETAFTSRNVRNPARSSEIVLKTWFSPDVDHWVRRNAVVRNGGHLVRNETVELVEFGRKK